MRNNMYITASIFLLLSFINTFEDFTHNSPIESGLFQYTPYKLSYDTLEISTEDKNKKLITKKYKVMSTFTFNHDRSPIVMADIGGEISLYRYAAVAYEEGKTIVQYVRKYGEKKNSTFIIYDKGKGGLEFNARNGYLLTFTLSGK